MPKRSSKKMDFNQLASQIVQRAVKDASGTAVVSPDSAIVGKLGLTTPDKNPAAVALGSLGGKRGGPARAKALSKEQRSKIAKKAAKARWAKPKRKK